MASGIETRPPQEAGRPGARRRRILVPTWRGALLSGTALVAWVAGAGVCETGTPASGVSPSGPSPEGPESGPGPATPFRPDKGRTAVLAETFDRLDVGPGRTWGWKSAAYPDCVTNRPNFKLDRLSTSAMSVASGVLTVTAAPQPDGRWQTGLLSTGDSCDSGGRDLEVRTGDVVAARVRLPDAETGAWPGVWTWRHGRNEIDIFEWHADRPGTLEFVNHVKGSAKFWHSRLVKRGSWLDIAVRLGAKRVTWYVGRPPGPLHAVFRDRVGVGPRFHSYLVAGLAVDDGSIHARPDSDRPFSFQIASLTVHRPADVTPAPRETGATRR
ncbi:hypothetical protein [Actinomadura xylanilytica]|uniref:hypothetical protein n=1 Tax=Actinomadura xylanilytica TaxID=887459 RepID=UPI00255A9B2D|nr:hypothetical protein [Actinomadura xylanilytica]MDL4773712.1 hypothetical protein [Actinomadura xylanilytica]